MKMRTTIGHLLHGLEANQRKNRQFEGNSSDIRLLIGDYDNNLKLERVAGTQQSTGEKKTRVQNFYHMRRRQRKKMTTEQSITRRED